MKQGDVQVEGDEGRYWLWYFHCDDTLKPSGVHVTEYRVVDCEKMVAFNDEGRWDLKNYGVRLPGLGPPAGEPVIAY